MTVPTSTCPCGHEGVRLTDGSLVNRTGSSSNAGSHLHGTAALGYTLVRDIRTASNAAPIPTWTTHRCRFTGPVTCGWCAQKDALAVIVPQHAVIYRRDDDDLILSGPLNDTCRRCLGGLTATGGQDPEREPDPKRVLQALRAMGSSPERTYTVDKYERQYIRNVFKYAGLDTNTPVPAEWWSEYPRAYPGDTHGSYRTKVRAHEERMVDIARSRAAEGVPA